MTVVRKPVLYELQTLGDDPGGLFDFLEPDEDASVVVTAIPGDHVPVEFWVVAVGVVATEVLIQRERVSCQVSGNRNRRRSG